MKSIWTDAKAEAEYNGILAKIDNLFRVPPTIARAEPHVFQQWFYKRQCEAARLRLEAAVLFLTFTTAP